jgi:hypothetical protein
MEKSYVARRRQFSFSQLTTVLGLVPSILLESACLTGIFERTNNEIKHAAWLASSLFLAFTVLG